ncbi:MAG: RNA polymerase sigma factor [Isosphaeraceae bacterium]
MRKPLNLPTPDGSPSSHRPVPGAGNGAVDWAAELARHERWLRTAVLARLGERQAVDEVFQEVALAAVSQRAPLQDRERVGAWLYRLAVRQALLYRRRRGRRARIDGRYATLRGDDESAPDAEPLDWLLLDERRDAVRLAMTRLSRRDAEILSLKYSEGWSYRELAVHLGIGESAVEARLHRARARLRSELAGSPVIEVAE